MIRLSKIPMTRREREIAKVSAELQLAKPARGGPEGARFGADAERVFVGTARSNGVKDMARGGWPDFLVKLPSGRVIGVEVKSGQARLSDDQVRMFTLLEAGGVETFVWWAVRPHLLQRWRMFQCGRGDQIALAKVLSDVR